MLKARSERKQKPLSQRWNLLVFAVGGRKLAMKIDEVSGISKWTGSIPVPSRTPFISAVIRQKDVVLPVFDLARLLHVSVRGDCFLCLMVKQPCGTMAICIDENIPVLHTLDVGAVQSYTGNEIPSIGSFVRGPDEIPIISLTNLGSA